MRIEGCGQAMCGQLNSCSLLASVRDAESQYTRAVEAGLPEGKGNPHYSYLLSIVACIEDFGCVQGYLVEASVDGILEE